MTPAYLLPPLAGQYAAFLRTIAAAPDDDTPRLVLADWLEEHAREMPCWCEASGYAHGDTCLNRCGRTGKVSNGCGERAEFIRVQCELAAEYECDYSQKSIDTCFDRRPDLDAVLRTGCHKCRKRVPRVASLRTIERTWMSDHRKAWRAMCALDTWLQRQAADMPHTMNGPPGVALFHRGFVDTVRGPLAALLGEECENCGGFGEFRRRHGNGDGPEGPCPDCGGKWNSGPHDDLGDYWDRGTGRTPGALERMGPELLAVRRVEATDREPWVNLDRTHWGWWGRNSYHNEDESLLDRELMLAMAADPARGDWDIGVRFTDDSPPGGCILFRAEAAARDALSRAVLSLARRRAGLGQPKSEAAL